MLLSEMNNYHLLNHYRVFTDTLFGVLLYYILFVQRLWMAPASKGALLNIHYYYYYYVGEYKYGTILNSYDLEYIRSEMITI